MQLFHPFFQIASEQGRYSIYIPETVALLVRNCHDFSCIDCYLDQYLMPSRGILHPLLVHLLHF